jgi:uncharacterized protein YwgA
MVDAFDVARLVYLNGGQLIGKTRLQKSAYFLETKGVGLGVDFNYHRFGPYSDELSSSTDDAQALQLLNVDWKASQAGTRYAVFTTAQAKFDESEYDRHRRQILDVLKKYSAVEVELAATADFLKRNGYANDPWAETRRRKASKVAEDRLAKAQLLLGEIEAL